jgi:hypothetical protein
MVIGEDACWEESAEAKSGWATEPNAGNVSLVIHEQQVRIGPLVRPLMPAVVVDQGWMFCGHKQVP